MRLEQLKYLLVISKANSMSLASKQLFISQQALSKAIKNLEDELDVQLLIRTNRGIKVTADGERVLEVAEQILQLTQELKHDFALPKTSCITGSLKIMTIPAARDQFLSKCISNFYKYYPNVDFEVLSGDRLEIIKTLLDGTIDLGFFSMAGIENIPFDEIPEQLDFVPFSKYRFCAMLSSHSPLAKFSTISIAQLLDYPAIFCPDIKIEKFNPYKLLQHFGPVQLRLVDSYVLLMQLIADNIGFSISPDTIELAFTPTPNIVIRPISDDLLGMMGYSYNKQCFDNQCIQHFLREFLESSSYR